MFLLDKLILKVIITKCAQLGGVFFLGAIEGAMLYAVFIAWGISIVFGKGAAKK